MLKRILSGGQTGVDRAALDVARDLGLATGGWCPKGRKAEDGEIDRRYPLEETPSGEYSQRTEWNVRDAEATLLLTWGEPTGGTAFTVECAQRLGRPVLCFDLAQGWGAGAFREWIEANAVSVLNIAGPRESRAPGYVYVRAVQALRDLLRPFRCDPASLYDPPSERLIWQTEGTFPKKELGERLSARFQGLEGGSLDRVFWHGGFYLNQKRRGFEEIPAIIPAGSKIEIYRFLREPEAIGVDESRILWDEAGILAVDKPAWLPVQGTRVSARFSLEETLRHFLEDPRLTAVHRLDRQTSGVVLFSKDAQAQALLGRQFDERKIRKSYLAIVSPPPTEEEWSTSGYLSRDFRRIPQVFYRLKAKKTGAGRWSETRFRRLAVRGSWALVEAEPLTGRTHQIRVHLASVGSPVLSDALYGRGSSEAERTQLHSHRISFFVPGPLGGGRSVTAPLPPDFLWRP
jgi:RluA family pseudouridine synthase